MFTIYRYSSDKQSAWDAFIAKSKNGTFLMYRGYMDYHSDRFVDCSLMFYLKEKLYAVIPANICGDTFYSHQGLTYGGLVMNEKCTAANILQLFEEMNEWLKGQGVKKVVYKPIPHIYSSMPAEEDLYALTSICRARLVIRDISSAIFRNHRMKFTESRKAGIRKAQRKGLVVRESTDFATFWHILHDNLLSKYAVRPVHSVDELELLHARFPENIRLYMVYDGTEPMGGTLLFLTTEVLHTQYISANAAGKANGAIDLLFDVLINEVYAHYQYIDFGKSTVSESADLNHKLIFQKEGFGSRAICYDTYEYTLS
ncbi:MAG: GNAT family N-acetyltransferase [Bacteroidaceae bacterium]|nr:GNAT family N-acetyltransferase [Bacteroidaceae bacterium]